MVDVGLLTAIAQAAMEGDTLSPEISKSSRYKHWISIEDEKRCLDCENNHGKIWEIVEIPFPFPPVHPFCRCRIENMNAIKAGTATIDGLSGADWSLKFKGALPENYVDKKEALQQGWKQGKWPSNFLPGKTIAGGVYCNDDGRLPTVPGRIWYEADINYKTGKRNSRRILWSNDGLIFVTYNHYETFYEIA